MPWSNWWSPAADDNEDASQSASQQAAQTVEEAVRGSKEHVHNAVGSSTGQIIPRWQTILEPQNILATVLLTSVFLGSFRVYRSFLRRIPQATDIDPSYLRKRSVLGKVVNVGDGDNFRIYHTPGGRLAGWGWLPWRKVPTDKKLLRNNTIHVRIAGVDAPEQAHFGRPAQPFSKEALEWLTSYVRGYRVRAHVYKIDQYSRVVATAYVWKGLLRRDIGLQMIRAGFATVYEAKSGAEFGEGLKEKYQHAEQQAKAKKKGMWAGDPGDFESPHTNPQEEQGSQHNPDAHAVPKLEQIEAALVKEPQ